MDGGSTQQRAWLVSAPEWARVETSGAPNRHLIKLSRMLLKLGPSQGDRVAIWHPGAAEGRRGRVVVEGGLADLAVSPTEARLDVEGGALALYWDIPTLEAHGLADLIGSEGRDLHEIDPSLLGQLRELDNDSDGDWRAMPGIEELLDEVDRRRSGSGKYHRDGIPFRFGYQYIPGRGKNW